MKEIKIIHVEAPIDLDKLAMVYAEFFLKSMCQIDTNKEK